MFKNLKSNASVTNGMFGRVYKGRAFLYVDGMLVDEQFNVIETNISITKAAKVITDYPSINGRTWFKKISVDELTDEARERLTNMGLLHETHQ